MTLPRIAIVGRPNVGKSALFNRIVGQRIAIVDSEEGITRDRLLAYADCFGHHFEVIDTGGIARQSPALFHNEIQAQTQWAIQEADALIFVVDGQVGITDLDQEVAEQLHKTKKPLLIAVNKVDHPSQIHLSNTFVSLGIPKIIPISCTQGWQIAELLEALIEDIETPVEKPETTELPIAIVGRPNVGKSTLINTLLDDSRCIVSPIPGTTRDSIDIPFTFAEETYTLIDTAGIRKKKGEKEVVDKFAAIRTERAIERSKVCLFLLDAEQGITAHDKRIARKLEQEGKGCVLLLNKWDLVKGFRMEDCFKELYEEIPFLRHCPKIFISAKTGRNLDKIFPLVQEVFTATTTRITTHQLNKTIENAMQRTHPPMITGKRLRVYYLTQVSIEPPSFVLFVNSPELMIQSYHKYLINQLRQAYTFSGTPIRLFLRGKEQKSANP